MKHSKLLEEFTSYQKETSWYTHSGEANAPELSYLVMGLAGEAGETCDEVNKLVREVGQRDDHNFNALIINPERRANLLKEMGDTLWYLNKLCTYMGITLEDLMVLNTIKLFHRTRENGKCLDIMWPFSPGTVSNEAITEEMTKMGAKGSYNEPRTTGEGE